MSYISTKPNGYVVRNGTDTDDNAHSLHTQSFLPLPSNKDFTILTG